MAASAAFSVLKWIGAAYLLFTGVRMLLTRSSPVTASGRGRQRASLARVFWQGAMTDVLNPKVALFFLAFLPQFVAAESAHKTLAFLVLGLIFISNGTLWCLGIAAFAARAAAASGNRQVRWPGSTACSAGCSSISGSASRCWRGAEHLQPRQPWILKNAVAGEIQAEQDHRDHEPAAEHLRLHPRPHRLSNKHAGKRAAIATAPGSAVAPSEARRR